MTMASGLYAVTFRDAINDATPITMNLTSASAKVMLYTDTKTPAFDTDAAYSATNEVVGTGYTANSKTVGGAPTCAVSGTGATTAVKYTWSTTVSWTTASFTARGMILHTVTDNFPFCAVTFGADYTATNGTFTITAHANGIFYIDLVP